MVRRLARVYPLHVVMLAANLLFRLLRIGLVMAGSSSRRRLPSR